MVFVSCLVLLLCYISLLLPASWSCVMRIETATLDIRSELFSCEILIREIGIEARRDVKAKWRAEREKDRKVRWERKQEQEERERVAGEVKEPSKGKGTILRVTFPWDGKRR